MKILITGASGLLGRKLYSIISRNHDIEGVYCSSPLPGLKYLDVTDGHQVESFLKGFNPEVIIHTAAYSDADYCESNKLEARKVNVKGTQNIVNICSKGNIKLVFISTDYVFDGKNPPYDETSPVNPVNFYGATKVECERYIEKELTDFIIVRPTILYGFNDRNSKMCFPLKVVSKLRKGEEVKVDGYIKKYPLLVDDLAKIIEILIVNMKRGVFHVASSKSVTRYEWALKTAEIFGLSKDSIKRVNTQNLAYKPFNVQFLCDKILSALGTVNISSIEVGLKTLKTQTGY